MNRPYAGLWANCELYVKLMQPFSDAIHQLEADRPMLSQVEGVVGKLRKHVEDFEKQHPQHRGVLELFEKRVKSTLTSPTTQLAYLMDPVNFVKTKDDGVDEWCPDVERFSAPQLAEAKALLGELWGGFTPELKQEAVEQWGRLVLHGVPKQVNESMELATKRIEKHDKKGNVVGIELAGMETRLRIWRKLLAPQYPALAHVANRILRMHATTCASERNWSLWGNLFTKARNRLGKERAEKLIYIRQNSRVLQKGRGGAHDEEVMMKLIEGLEVEE